MPLLDVRSLTTRFYTYKNVITAVDSISFSVDAGEILSIVGVSGSGKSVACYSLVQLIEKPAGRIESGISRFNGTDLFECDSNSIQNIRGNDISIVSQEPRSSFNPYLCMGEQLIEPLLRHKHYTKKQAHQKAISALEEVGIDQAEQRFYSYPYEFSNGMCQRVMIAMALITDPKLLIMDDSTSTLDVTVQAQIIKLIKQLQCKRNMAVIFVSHDLGVVAGIADRILIMSQGRIVEHGTTEEIFYNAQHHYTKQLLNSTPSGEKKTAYTPSAPPLLSVAKLQTYFRDGRYCWFSPFLKKDKCFIKAVDDVDIDVHRGEIVGLVGESGSGKSTLARSILQLLPIKQGSILFDDCELTHLSASAMRAKRKKIQMIFQNPYACLNPSMNTFDILAEPLLYHGLANKKTIDEKVCYLMDEIGLLPIDRQKYPHELSGGQCQQIAIGRAIATQPEFIIADELMSTLDVTVQAQILELILNLVEKYSLAMLFIARDLSIVRGVCDRVAIMKKGKIIECGDTETVFTHPVQPYTQSLLEAIPMADSNTSRACSH